MSSLTQQLADVENKERTGSSAALAREEALQIRIFSLEGEVSKQKAELKVPVVAAVLIITCQESTTSIVLISIGVPKQCETERVCADGHGEQG